MPQCAPITSFWDKYRFLSNFWLADMEYDGTQYISSEHAFQSQKTFSEVERRRINRTDDRPTTPGEAKRAAGPKAKVPITLRPDWEQVKFIFMEDILRIKFADPELRRWLLDTGDAELIEGNKWHDREFGVCTCPVHNGEGLNRLGIILMKIRAEIRNAAPC